MPAKPFPTNPTAADYDAIRRHVEIEGPVEVVRAADAKPIELTPGQAKNVELRQDERDILGIS